jgi:uncharacterized protein (TIGR02001 family)
VGTSLATRSGKLASAALATALLLVSATARAQLAASVSVESDYRIRGRSVSDKYPVASFRLGLDDASGIYTDGSASVVVTSDDGPRYLGYQFDAGFATRLGALWTLDLGVAHDDFRALYPGGRPYRRTEAYLGARRGAFSAYLFASPRYANLDSATLYGQLEATISPARLWRVTAHAGALELLDANAPFSSLYDWRLGASRQLGSFELHAAVSGSIPGREAHRAGIPSRTALTAGASYGF